MKLEVLVFAAHPGDAEEALGGTLALMSQQGYGVGVVDMTWGEVCLGRDPSGVQGAWRMASREMGLAVRENLGLPDGCLENDGETRLRVVEMVRRYLPDIVMAPHWEAESHDARVTGLVVTDACFLAGLARIAVHGPRWRPRYIVYYHLPPWVYPSFVVEISRVWDIKMRAVRAYGGDIQETGGRESAVEDLGRFYGSQVHGAYGEGFYVKGVLSIPDPVGVLGAPNRLTPWLDRFNRVLRHGYRHLRDVRHRWRTRWFTPGVPRRRR